MGTTDAGEWVRCGREFSAEEIRRIRETVARVSGLARGELAATVREHPDRHTAAGTPKMPCTEPLPGRPVP